MRLTHVLVERFRGIGRLELALDRLTVVIGENNHGKSSLMDVLERCLGSPDGGPPTHFEPGDFRRTPASRPEPIRVVLGFEHAGGGARGKGAAGVFDLAMTPGGDGHRRLRVEFVGRPDTGAMEVRFLDGGDRPLDPQPPGVVLSRLRRLHPVLVVRLAQPHERAPLEWSRAEERDEPEPSEGRFERDIARVYRSLTHARGPVPPEDLRRAFRSAYQMRDAISERYLTRGGSLRGVLEQLVVDGDGGGGPRAPQPGSGSHALGLLLVIGSLIDVRGDATLPTEAEPLLAIEEPEVHLHPTLIASTWDVIENLRAQALVVTNSGEFLSNVPLRFLRRLVRRDGHIDAHQLGDHTLSSEGLRRVGYHIRAKGGSALFARCWLLVEGETEFWLVRQLAQVLGYDLEAEGVRCVEFAQCGVEPLVRLADDLHIEWHLLSDGDDSGAAYAGEARAHLHGRPAKRHVTRLRRRNVEMELWHGGFADVYRRAAGLPEDGRTHYEGKKLNPYHIVARAIRRHSKPWLALTVAEECARRGPDSVPGSLRHVIEASVTLARNAIRDGSGTVPATASSPG
jgi:putative ATP-dependent endonuclease of OLD family